MRYGDTLEGENREAKVMAAMNIYQAFLPLTSTPPDFRVIWVGFSALPPAVEIRSFFIYYKM